MTMAVKQQKNNNESAKITFKNHTCREGKY